MIAGNSHGRERFDFFGAACHGGGGGSQETDKSKTVKTTTTTRVRDIGLTGNNATDLAQVIEQAGSQRTRQQVKLLDNTAARIFSSGRQMTAQSQATAQDALSTAEEVARQGRIQTRQVNETVEKVAAASFLTSRNIAESANEAVTSVQATQQTGLTPAEDRADVATASLNENTLVMVLAGVSALGALVSLARR